VEERRRTRFDDAGLVVGGRRLPLRAGALHYWRSSPTAWSRLLTSVRQLGCTAIDTPVPWAVHAPGERHFDWSGGRDLGAFLRAVGDAGLHAVLRPGPWVDAQLTFGGLPEHIVRDPDMQARAAHGGPAWLPNPPRAHPLPSLASARYQAAVATWMAEVGRVVGPHLAPDGPVVALAVDHHGAAGYRGAAFDLDYHPDALAWWREVDDREPPTRWADDDAARCVAWVRWKEQYLARGLGAVVDALIAAGLGDLARFHAAPPAAPWHADLPAMARAIDGPVSIDVSGGAGDLAAIRERGLWVSGSSAAAAPFSVGCGHATYLPPRTDAEQRAAALVALAAGARAVTVTMAVARDRWIGGALDHDGRPAGTAARSAALKPAAPAPGWVSPLLHALERLGWHGLRRRARVALIASRADARFGLASSVLDPAPPLVAELLRLGPGGSANLGRDADAVTYRRWFAAAAAALDLAQVPYAIVDESAGAARLLAFDAIVAPTLHRVDRGLWRDLTAAAAARKVVVYGPELPTHDELGQPLVEPAPRRAGRMRAGSLEDLAGLAEDLAALVEPPLWSIERPAGLHVDVFDDDGGRARVAIVTNPGAGPVRARLVTPGDVALVDALHGERLPSHDGVITIALGGGDARWFEIVAAPTAG
jgi:beta-galactosidase